MQHEIFVSPHLLTKAVLLIIFKRLNTTKQVFEAIRKAKPPRLYIAADGPRKAVLREEEKVNEVRNYVLSNINWDCEVKTLFSGENLGMKYAESKAMNWFFENEKMGIILEDDCLPSQSFFWFCEELLERYKDDDRFGMVSGNNFQFGRRRTEYSYYFSNFYHMWGWASWQRAWKHFDINMTAWPEIREQKWLYDILKKSRYVRYWQTLFEKTYREEINTWDYQWVFTNWINHHLCILPNVNLVSNIGFGEEATNTFKVNHIRSNIPCEDLQFPLLHPTFIIPDKQADKYTLKKIYKINNYKSIKKILAKIPGLKKLWSLLIENN